jgi:lysozyme family protein
MALSPVVDFDRVIDQVLAKEEGFVDHPSDHGGPTCWGITQAVARANGWTGQMQDLPVGLARSIYRARYIERPRFDAVCVLSGLIGQELIDTGVNMGPSRAAEFLQRWLNGFNLQGSRYADVFVDGQIGDVTLDALRSFIAWRGELGVRVMVCALNSVQGARYLELAEANDSQEDFLFGWIRSRVLEPA